MVSLEKRTSKRKRYVRTRLSIRKSKTKSKTKSSQVKRKSNRKKRGMEQGLTNHIKSSFRPFRAKTERKETEQNRKHPAHRLPKLNFLVLEGPTPTTCPIPPVASLSKPANPIPVPPLIPPSTPTPPTKEGDEEDEEEDENAADTAGMLSLLIHPPLVFSFCGRGMTWTCVYGCCCCCSCCVDDGGLAGDRPYCDAEQDSQPQYGAWSFIPLPPRSASDAGSPYCVFGLATTPAPAPAPAPEPAPALRSRLVML
jgi:hypothetical protein